MGFDTRLTVIISAAKKENLSEPQRQFLAGLEDRIRHKGLRILPESATSDSLEDRFEKVRQSHGVIVFACGQWEAGRLYRTQQKSVVFPSEFCHIMSAMAVTAKRPLLVIREKSVAERGAFRAGYLPHVVKSPASLKTEWLDDAEFDGEFDKWIRDVECYRHVFLGYSSKATDTANAIHRFLSEKLKLRVFDWHDFRVGDSVWESIERAERLTDFGLFLFMADDKLVAGNKGEFAPRDNVVYEAGYFAGAKGRQKSLLVREEGAKVPTDLGGILYVKLVNRNDISPTETPLREHLKRMLGADR
jgi:hypothetical protein